MSYTREEERWFEKQLGLIDEVFRSVTIGDEILNEFFMFSLGVPLSRNYMKSVISITLERVWRLFNAHPDFEELPSHSQLDMMATNGPVACAAMICRYESRPLGIQQIQVKMNHLKSDPDFQKYFQCFKSPDGNVTKSGFVLLLKSYKSFVDYPQISLMATPILFLIFLSGHLLKWS